MSIQYCVAATLVRGRIEEANYHLPADREVTRLLAATNLEPDADFTANYPRMQGSEVTVILWDGETRQRRLDDLVPASPAEIRERFRLASKNASAVESVIDNLEEQEDVGILGNYLSTKVD
jgi:2-methylcitrate dehydratase PrpD